MANTVVLGAGIIGVSTAYYLSRHQPGNTIHLVEPSPELFASASGNAGGFLARDWFGPGAASLGALSFDEHRRLAEAHDGAARWGYSRSTALSYTYASPGAGRKGQRGEDWLQQGTSRANSATGSTTKGNGGGDDDDDGLDALVPPWLRRGKGASIKPIGDASTTAQLDPRLLCRFLLDECLGRGVRLHHPARAVAVMSDVRDELSSVTIADTTSSTETDVPCTRLIITAGAWSPQVFTGLFPRSRSKLPVSSLAGHSLVLRSPRWNDQALEEGKGCHAVFTTTRSGFAPEIFSRVGGEIYVAGLNSASLPLPALATERQISGEAIEEVRRVAAKLLGVGGEDAVVDDLEVVREGLCFRPVTPYGTPIISRINDELLGGGITTRPDAEGGVFLAAGHGPWGISHSLGTGMVLAEICQGRHLSADVRSLVIW
ncbi:hypothetical protein VMCG_06825 [Cytospora schulzeri]|uniref:FAD dependent oxidoreductase domain-containing protein n=1 Tax=Cytospora schulzeri TaxID=448051 RepID=A0A423W5U4_9PEZI|nr:hypothetical protein VMCG_06825 [Valsa malicola]